MKGNSRIIRRLKETKSKMPSNFSCIRSLVKKLFSTERILKVFQCHLKRSKPNKIDCKLNKGKCQVQTLEAKRKIKKKTKKKTKKHDMSRNYTFQAVPNNAQPALRDKSHNSQSFFSICFLFIGMLTLMVFPQPFRKQCLSYPCKKK